MATREAAAVRAPSATAARVLLHRRAAVYPPPARREAPNPGAVPGVELLEADLLDRGWLLSAPARAALVRLDVADLVGVGSALLADCDALLGADRPHVPLFRRFPESTPADTGAFYVDRVLVAWFQFPGQPCVLCTREGTVAPVNPCGHLVCRACFDGSDFSACPICHRRIDLDDPFLRPSKPRPARSRWTWPWRSDRAGLPARRRVLHLGTDLAADAGAELAGLLARPSALSPGDTADLAVLLDLQSREDLGWVPARVPGRETKARLLAWLLDGPPAAGALDVAARLVDTATDVLRLLVVRSGGAASLIDRPRLAPVSRPLRRALLALLDRIEPERLVEDMRRHRRAWIAAGERLHPGEYAARYPSAAVAFAALRGTDLGGDPGSPDPDGPDPNSPAPNGPDPNNSVPSSSVPSSSVPNGPAPGRAGLRKRRASALMRERVAASRGVEIVDGRVSAVPWARPVELALAAGDVATATSALTARPGELARRLDHLLRLARTPEQQDAVLAGLARAVPRVSAGVLLSALGEIRTRTSTGGTRVFFPAAATAAAHVAPDERPALPAPLVERAVGVLDRELLRRATALPPVGRAVIDTGLDTLTAPFAERTAARALVTLARGSVLPVPPGRHLRLFCHWTESARRVDLDLSVAFYDAAWTHVATCDYTNLRLDGAVHSGDLTSAPPPLGASEFVDLDVEVLGTIGARYAVVVVFSFDDVPFTETAEAFAGVMVRADAPTEGEVFDARAVEQRFDLTGPGKVTLPLVVDLAEHTMRWLDVSARVTGTGHAVHRHQEQIATLASALTAAFEAGSRVTLGELGRRHVAARAEEVLVRDGARLARFRRRPDEDIARFAARLDTGADDGPAAPEEAADAELQLLVRADLPAPAGAQV
ncbi:MAG TPA: RING finger family 4 domain-containing protein, partial [Pseudonocardia sp.]|nr:RING finger family 4 domain-containing protein [Pseudonocardia sp.]